MGPRLNLVLTVSVTTINKRNGRVRNTVFLTVTLNSSDDCNKGLFEKRKTNFVGPYRPIVKGGEKDKIYVYIMDLDTSTKH